MTAKLPLSLFTNMFQGAATQFTTRQYIHERKAVEEALFDAVKTRLSGNCCEQDCDVSGKLKDLQNNYVTWQIVQLLAVAYLPEIE